MNATDLYYDLFQKYLATNGLSLNLDENKSLVKRYLTAEYAGQLYSEDKYYEVLLKDDAMIKRVLKKS
jgi:carboxyl-terminal processing protease